ncbi:hypothetical protein [Candidatus Enterovibrio escicola]|uniref:hypothetical protein n=1 Tax=Candidatus Enterovibrio escicola TaxID=1927127 RepID=UPI001237B5FC|nr:hypothetical protein [Candidatus Enterovibrio escacola]
MKYDVQSLFNNLLKSNYALDKEIKKSISIIVDNSETQKGAMTVIATGLVYKHYHASQDVRKHQSNMEGGYSGRSFDSNYITPFLRENSFPHMAESGWLTRSLEQAMPYDRDYPGKISGKGVRQAFLDIYNATTDQQIVEPMLVCFFQKMVQKRDITNIKLTCPANLTIDATLKLIETHIETKYSSSGTARLPNIAIYAAYVCAINASKGRYEGKIIEPLNSHTASDKSSGSIGDIQINDSCGNPFEGIEIKARAIEPSMIEAIYRKIQEYSTVSRYYILTTYEDEHTRNEKIKNEVTKIRSKHGCDVVVNGVYNTLKYFLRLSDTKDFIKLYTDLMATDEALKFEHKSKWNDLCLGL